MGSGFRRSDEYIATVPIDAFDTGSKPGIGRVRQPIWGLPVPIPGPQSIRRAGIPSI